MPDGAAITGLGVVTAAGIGIESLWDALMESRQCVGAISLFDAGEFDSQIGAELADFSARKFVPKTYRKSVKVMARDIEIAVAAADLAIRDSGITSRGIDPDAMDIDPKRLGCNIGAGLINTDLDELGMAVSSSIEDGQFSLKKWGSAGINDLTPLWLLKYLPNMLACHVTIIHGAEGPSNTITCGDASAHLAVGEAARMVAQGRADAIIAGGAETKLNPMGLLRQELLQRTCNSRNDSPAGACRPFDVDHDGTVVGEGGGIIIIEDMDRALSRGAKLYAEFAGFGAACNPAGMHVTEPTAGGLDLAVKRAIADAGITPDDVDLIVTHGTAVAKEDNHEATAWANALGDAVSKIPAVAVTGSVGSLYAGAGGVELAIAAMAVQRQMVPPSVNFAQAADGCRLQLSDKPVEKEINYVVTGAFGTGGQSAAAVLKRCQI